ncbi:uncharacterized protein FTOL_05415 [Fusarium torulosum]|uniref:C-type lectin domain-containing protein n=1 Tax=Fusarium torulosum TaxID=33205 RepID=A0AAE8M7L8_9HYPO|nr:uncharacterized protein FTOL_05415 [Fusarium torulosum]
MHFTNLLAGSALIYFTDAFKVPKGTTDGFYKVHLNAQGQEIHQRVSNFETEATPAEVSIVKRTRIEKREPLWSRWCGCGNELNHGNCDDAVQDLKDQMGSTVWVIGPQAAFYSIRGDAVAFSCNTRDDVDALTTADWVTMAAEVATYYCGWYIAGTGQWNWIDPNFNSTVMGYMIWGDGVDFCGNAEASSSLDCW